MSLLACKMEGHSLGGHLKSQRRKNLRFSKLNELGEPQFPHLKTEVNGIPPDYTTGRKGGLEWAHAFLSFAFAGLSAKKARPLCLLVRIPWVHHTRTSMPTGEAPFRGPLPSSGPLECPVSTTQILSCVAILCRRFCAFPGVSGRSETVLFTLTSFTPPEWFSNGLLN